MYCVFADLEDHKVQVFCTTLDRGFWALAGYSKRMWGYEDHMYGRSIQIDPYPYNVDDDPKNERFQILDMEGETIVETLDCELDELIGGVKIWGHQAHNHALLRRN
jgi:hypothetical protein